MEQSNSHISQEEININKKINNELLNLQNSNLKKDEEHFLTSLLWESKKINTNKIPTTAKNEECKFRAEASTK